MARKSATIWLSGATAVIQGRCVCPVGGDLKQNAIRLKD